MRMISCGSFLSRSAKFADTAAKRTSSTEQMMMEIMMERMESNANQMRRPVMAGLYTRVAKTVGAG